MNKEAKLHETLRRRRQLMSTGALPAADAATLPVTPTTDLPLLTGEALDYLVREASVTSADNDGAPVVDASVDRDAYLSELERIKAALAADPDTLEQALLGPVLLERDSARRPAADFRFRAWSDELTPDPASYRVEDHTFETFGDLMGWIVNCGQVKIPRVAQANRARASALFQWHHSKISQFKYTLKAPTGQPIKLAIVADFGTGLVHSQYIARQLAEAKYPYVFQLGDIYYAGREEEYRKFYRSPMKPILEGGSKVFALAGNHEQYSGNQNYWNDIHYRQDKFPVQEQEGSYFRLLGDHYQIIGCDTNSLELESYSNPLLLDWLLKALREGRSKGLSNILLTSEHAYDFLAVLPGRGKIYRDIASSSDDFFHPTHPLVDFWAWGHVHYGSFNDAAPDEGFPFIGTCVGHGGYPFGVKKKPKKPSFIRWVEDAPRFPKETGVRQDMGRNGYLVVELGGTELKLIYMDWMGNRRCEVAIDRDPTGHLMTRTVKVADGESL